MKRSIVTLLGIGAACASSAFAQNSSLYAIPTLSGANTAATVAQITPDGQYVVGNNESASYLYKLGAASSTLVIGNGAQATAVYGVGLRTSAGRDEIIIRGLSAGYLTEWMSLDGTSIDNSRRRSTAETMNVMTSFNGIGSRLGSDQYFTGVRAGTASAGDNSPTIMRQAGAWIPTTLEKGTKSTTAATRLNGASADGRVVGRRLNTPTGGVQRGENYTMYWAGATTPAAAYFAGLDGSNRGEAFGVSQDGKVVVGASPSVAGDADSVLYPYKAVFSAWNNNTLSSVTALPLLAGNHSSTTKAVPFGASSDGGWIVGYDYHDGLYNAVLWDTRDANSANWTALDLTQYASNAGILDGFTRLNRAYSVGVDAEGYVVVAGIGTYTGGVTRAFAFSIVPEPGTLSLLALGIFGFIVARKRD